MDVNLFKTKVRRKNNEKRCLQSELTVAVAVVVLFVTEKDVYYFFLKQESQTHEIVSWQVQVILSLSHRCRAVNFNKIGCPDAYVCTFTLVRSLIPFYPTKTSEPLKTGAQGNWEQTKCLHCSNMSKLSRSTKHKSAFAQRAHVRCVSIRTSCPQLPRRPPRCVRARPLKVNGRMTLWCLEEGKVLHFTAFKFDFICWQVWPASFRSGCYTSLKPSGLFLFYNVIFALWRSRYTSRPVFSKWKQKEALYLKVLLYEYFTTSFFIAHTLFRTPPTLSRLNVSQIHLESMFLRVSLFCFRANGKLC